MKYYPEKERQADGHPGILEGVQSLKVCGFVDGDVSVDSHADDDVDRAGHEGVDEGHHQMCLSLSLVVGNYGGQLTYQVNASELHFARSFQGHPT